MCALSVVIPVLAQPFDYYRFTAGYYGNYGFGEIANWNRAYVPVFCLFLYGSASQGGSGYAARLFSSDVLVGLGDISLAVYVLQATVARMCGVRWLRRGPNQEDYCKDLSFMYNDLPGKLWATRVPDSPWLDQELADAKWHCINATGEQVALLIVMLLIISSIVTYKVEPMLDEYLRGLISLIRELPYQGGREMIARSFFSRFRFLSRWSSSSPPSAGEKEMLLPTT